MPALPEDAFPEAEEVFHTAGTGGEPPDRARPLLRAPLSRAAPPCFISFLNLERLFWNQIFTCNGSAARLSAARPGPHPRPARPDGPRPPALPRPAVAPRPGRPRAASRSLRPRAPRLPQPGRDRPRGRDGRSAASGFGTRGSAGPGPGPRGLGARRGRT